MKFFSTLTDELSAMRDLLGAVETAAEIPGRAEALSDADVLAVLEAASRLERGIGTVKAAASGVVAVRSRRDAGKNGLAQSRGFANPTKLIQHTTGVGRGEAARHVRVGESLFDTEPTVLDAMPDTPDGAGDERTSEGTTAVALAPWHQPLTDELLAGTISSAQNDAIRCGLGEPPAQEDTGRFAAVCAGWHEAAAQLIDAADHMTVEELATQARVIRDQLDPAGAEARYLQRYEKRAFRLWTDADGLTRANMVLDDMSAAWVKGVIDSALKPRRGGPRFMTGEERARAEALQQDGRTNEQLTFDLIVDLLRAGTLADVENVHGVRQAGVRVVTVVDTDGDTTEAVGVGVDVPRAGPGGDADAAGRHGGGEDGPNIDAANPAFTGRSHIEETGIPVPAWEAAQVACGSGIVPVSTDRHGNPLDVGREQRLFTTKQRIGIAIRDGGCMWPECDRPPSYCETHHIDEWALGGRTDVERGISLCRFHHLQLHNGGWRITRDSWPRRADSTLQQGVGPSDARRTSIRHRSSGDGPGEFLLHPATPPRAVAGGTGGASTGAPRSRTSAPAPAPAPRSAQTLGPIPTLGAPREPIVLRRRLAARYQWGELCPPHQRFRGG